MLDRDLARIRTHRNNIHRYRRLLGTKVSDVERQLIERRLSEEQTALTGTGRRKFPRRIYAENRRRTREPSHE
jgi:hypothetical protein